MDIEDTLREYDWAIRLGLIAVAVVLVALITNRLIAWGLTPMTVPKTRDFSSIPSPSKDRETTSSPNNEATQWDDAIAQKCLFGCPEQQDQPKKCPGGCKENETCKKGVCVPEEPDEKQTNQPDVPVESDLNIKLMGCMVARNPSYSMALIQDGKSEETYIISTGDKLPNQAEVVRIKRDRIFIRHEGQLQYIQLQQTIGGDPSPVSVTETRRSSRTTRADEVSDAVINTSGEDDSTSGEGAGTEGSSVEKVSRGEYAVDSEALEEKLENPEELAREVRAVPNYDGSSQEKNGVKLMGVSPSGTYSEMGLKSGDVLQSVNGQKVTSQEEAYEMLDQLRDEGSVSVQIERNGERVEREYQIE